MLDKSNGVLLEGDVKVYTTQYRGFTPEEIAEQAIGKIMYVGKDSHPAIRDQAEAFKGYIKNIGGLIMAISQAMCTSFKVDILNGIHAFGTTVTRATTAADTFKIALYTSSATLGATTTAYSTSNEVATGGGYTAGGNTLSVSQVPTSTSGDFTIVFPAADASNAIIRIA